MLKVYGTLKCPDCVACKKAFAEQGIDAEFIDINGELKNLKEFLHIRDTYDSVFDEVRKAKGIGIPCIVTDDGAVTLNWERFVNIDRNALKDGSACSVDGKGC